MMIDSEPTQQESGRSNSEHATELDAVTRDNQATSPTLLGKLRGDFKDEDWSEFVDRYAPAVFSWALQFGLQESDAADVTQEVLLKLLDRMKSFSYDPKRGSFRGWLKTVTVNAARDCGRKIMRFPGGPAGLSGVGESKAWDDLAQKMEDEYRRELLGQASEMVQERVAENTWHAYQLTAVENQPAALVAEQLGIKVSDVYVSKSRVIKQLRDAVAELERIDSGLG